MTPERIKAAGDKVATVISVVFHPLLMPLFGMLIIFSAPTLFGFLPLEKKSILLIIVLINNVLLPLSLMPFFRYRNIISSWVIENRKERTIPLMATTFFYFISAYIFVFIRFHIPVFLKLFILVAAILSMAVTIVNFWWKISIHAAGAGALTAVVVVLSIQMQTQLIWFLVAALLSSGLILSSRLWLDSHSPGEVWFGYLLGLLVPGLFLFLF
jgi:hypothetical protein